MTHTPRLKIWHAALLAAIIPTLAIASTPTPHAVIAARHAGFKKMGGAMKALSTQLKSDAPVTAVMVGAARSIAASAREQTKLFPAGSGPASGIKTDALATIWTDRANFDAQMNRLISESNKLVATAASGDASAIGAQLKATGAVCGACHRQFRADN